MGENRNLEENLVFVGARQPIPEEVMMRKSRLNAPRRALRRQERHNYGAPPIFRFFVYLGLFRNMIPYLSCPGLGHPVRQTNSPFLACAGRGRLADTTPCPSRPKQHIPSTAPAICLWHYFDVFHQPRLPGGISDSRLTGW